MTASTNIHPIFTSTLARADKEALLGQKSVVVWMVGLSGSGKSTLAIRLERALHEQGRLTFILDGDNLRTGLNKNLGFSEEDRQENLRRAAEAAKLLVQAGVIVIASFISPTEQVRAQVREIIGTDDYCEVFVNSSLASCEARDVKGLYAKARSGQIKQFTGIDAPFEPPVNPALELRTDQNSVEECAALLEKAILDRTKR
jgi:adenylylsulfate kinase